MESPFAQDPAVMGGRLCLAGTRVTVRAVEELIEQHLSDEEIAAELPVSKAQVRAVRARMGELRRAGGR